MYPFRSQGDVPRPRRERAGPVADAAAAGHALPAPDALHLTAHRRLRPGAALSLHPGRYIYLISSHTLNPLLVPTHPAASSSASHHHHHHHHRSASTGVHRRPSSSSSSCSWWCSCCHRCRPVVPRRRWCRCRSRRPRGRPWGWGSGGDHSSSHHSRARLRPW
jgi:hypothetical protein